MGWSFRKSFKVGPIRVTASKSGLSFSWGVKGFRITRQANGKIRQTFTIPGTGLSYSNTIDNPLSGLGKKESSSSKKTAKSSSSGKTASLPSSKKTTAGRGKPLPGDTVVIPTTVEEASELVPEWCKVVERCQKTCSTTVKPEAFFSSFDELERNMRRLAAVEKLVTFEGEQPSDALSRLTESRPEAVRDLIDRSYRQMLEDAQALKTKKGQDGRILKYFETMELYADQLGEDGVEYLHSLKALHISDDQEDV